MIIFKRLQPCLWEGEFNALISSRLRTYENPFNPSIVGSGTTGNYTITFRAFGDIKRLPFRAYLGTYEQGRLNIMDLSAHLEGYGIKNVADPKLLASDGEVWCTFNTGYVRGAYNEIYLMRISPSMGIPRKVNFPARQAIEKNWAFFRRAGVWHCIYRVAPLTILRETTRDDSADVEFGLDFECTSRVDRDLSIGTQLCESPTGLHLIAHEKFHLRRHRMYFGKLLGFDYERRTIWEVDRRLLIHNYRSLLRARVRWNPHLISCTYFSGLAYDANQEKHIVAYGINDVDFNFSTLAINRSALLK